MHFSTDMKVVLFLVVWLLLSSLVQWDIHGIRWKNALYNSFVGPVVYTVMVPFYFAVKGFLIAKEWLTIDLPNWIRRKETNR